MPALDIATLLIIFICVLISTYGSSTLFGHGAQLSGVCELVGFVSLLFVNELQNNVVTLPFGSSKTCSKLQHVPCREPNIYQPT